MPLSIKMKQEETVKSWPFRPLIYNMPKALLHIEIWWLSQGRALVQLSYELNCLLFFSIQHCFSLNNCKNFLKNEKWAVTSRETTDGICCIGNDKIWTFDWKLNVGRLVSATVNLTVSQCLKPFLMRPIVTVLSVVVWCWRMKCVNVWKVHIPWWPSLSRWPMHGVTKSRMDQRAT